MWRFSGISQVILSYPQTDSRPVSVPRLGVPSAVGTAADTHGASKAEQRIPQPRIAHVADAALQLGHQILEAAVLPESGAQAQIGQGPHLGIGIGGVAMAAHQGQVLVIDLAGASEAAGPQIGGSHGAAGGEAHARPLAGGAVVLAEVGHRQLEQRTWRGLCG